MQIVHNRDWAEPALPPAPRLAAVPDTDPPGGTTFGLAAIARMLGVERRSPKWQAAYLRELIAAEGFPAPIPILSGGALSRDIHPRKSRWHAVAVRAWFLSQVPAHAVASVADAEALEAAAAAASRLDDAAADLFADPPSGGRS